MRSRPSRWKLLDDGGLISPASRLRRQIEQDRAVRFGRGVRITTEGRVDYTRAGQNAELALNGPNQRARPNDSIAATNPDNRFLPDPAIPGTHHLTGFGDHQAACDMRGVAFENADQEVRTDDFLFDMNLFFQRLLSRFLHENLRSSNIEDEMAVRNMFLYRHGPAVRALPISRPDYALFHRGHLHTFLDAKYRDLWNKRLQANWLYQLSMYALAAPSKTSVLLYATMSLDAQDERIEIRQPIAHSLHERAIVILRPVPMLKLAKLVHPTHRDSSWKERQELAEGLVAISAMHTTPGRRLHSKERAL